MANKPCVPLSLSAGELPRAPASLRAITHSDAELIALCDAYVAESERKRQEWQTADEVQRRVLALDFSPWVPRQEVDKLFNMAQRISYMRAQTPQGLRAKARMLKCWLAVNYAVGERDDEPRFGNEPELAAAWSLMHDMLVARLQPGSEEYA